jgi:hypothetical protein
MRDRTTSDADNPSTWMWCGFRSQIHIGRTVPTLLNVPSDSRVGSDPGVRWLPLNVIVPGQALKTHGR